MFGSKKKQQEKAESDARWEVFTAWFDAVTETRPAGLSSLTDDLLGQVGSPFAGLLRRGTAAGDLEVSTARAYGRERAARLSRQAIVESDSDARSRHAFWDSVSNWF